MTWTPPDFDEDVNPEVTDAIMRIDIELARDQRAKAYLDRVVRCAVCGGPGLVGHHPKDGSGCVQGKVRT